VAATAVISLPARAQPGWFSGVMGTASLAVVAFRLPGDLTWANSVGTVVGWVFLGLAVLSLVILLAANLAAPLPRGELAASLGSREWGPAYAAAPGAVLAIVLALQAVAPDVSSSDVAGWLTLVICVAMVAIDLLLTLIVFTSAIINPDALEPNALTGVWFLPQSVLLLASAALAHLSNRPDSSIAEVAAPIAVLLLGAGLIMFLLVGAIVLDRLIAAPFLPVGGLPATWTLMSPSSAASLALLAIPVTVPTLLGQPSTSVTPVTTLMAGALVGFGLLWLLVVATLTARTRGQALSFSPASWGFVFPLAALSVATGSLANSWDAPLMVAAAILMAILGIAVWLVVTCESFRWVRANMRGRGQGQQ